MSGSLENIDETLERVSELFLQYFEFDERLNTFKRNEKPPVETDVVQLLEFVLPPDEMCVNYDQAAKLCFYLLENHLSGYELYPLEQGRLGVTVLRILLRLAEETGHTVQEVEIDNGEKELVVTPPQGQIS